MVDDDVTHLQTVRDRPVWQPMPDPLRASWSSAVPEQPQPPEAVYAEVQANLLPYSMGNIHPRFWGWYMGSGNLTGALGDFLAAVDGSNLGGGNTAAAQLDRQVVNWLKDLMRFPPDASGALTSGGSMANMVGLAVARNAMAGVDVRAEGVTDLPQALRFYASHQVHSCHQKAMETLGLGSRALRPVPTDDHFRMRLPAPEEAIAEDRAAGLRPACVMATAGTTNTGAFDDFSGIGDLCRREGLWYQVDGWIGALVKLAPENRWMVDGPERADSLALDPHKGLHTPFEAGCALVRDRDRHFGRFALHGDYLEEKPRGVASGEYLFDYGFELSRGFKALKIRISLKEQGREKSGRLIDQNIAQGAYLTDLIEAEPMLELMAPTAINIVCFRHRLPDADEAEIRALNTEVMLRPQEEGTAVATDTTLRGRHCLRVAINTHRTRREDLGLLLREFLRLGHLLGGNRPTAD